MNVSERELSALKRFLELRASNKYVDGRPGGLGLLLTGRVFLGREAAELGVANQALPSAEVLLRAREIARYIVERCAPASVALTKRLIWEHLGHDDPYVASLREARGLTRLGRLPDAGEGVMAFIQKRPAQWKLTARDAPDVD